MSGVRTIQARAALKVLDAARRAGVPRAKLCAAAGLDAAALEDPEHRIPYAQFVALYEHAAVLGRDEDFGLHVAEQVTAGMFDVLGYAVMNSATVSDAIQRLIRYYGIW